MASYIFIAMIFDSMAFYCHYCDDILVLLFPFRFYTNNCYCSIQGCVPLNGLHCGSNSKRSVPTFRILLNPILPRVYLAQL